MDVNACNYKKEANEDDNSCNYLDKWVFVGVIIQHAMIVWVFLMDWQKKTKCGICDLNPEK